MSMTKTLFLVLSLALTLALALASTASADNPLVSGRFQLVGYTDTVSTGDLGGPLGATLSCQEAGFPAARMCTTLEILLTTAVPAVSGEAWVWASPVINRCLWWTSSTENATTISEEGVPGPAACSEILPIACCALVQ